MPSRLLAIKASFLRIVFGAAACVHFGGCTAVPAKPAVAAANRTYSVLIQGTPVTFAIPHQFTPGYSGVCDALTFDHSRREHTGFQLPGGALQKIIAVFYSGVQGDFASWQQSIEVSAISFPAEKGLITTDDALQYVKDLLGKPYVLKDGSTYAIVDSFLVSQQNGRSVITALSTAKTAGVELALNNHNVVYISPRVCSYVLLGNDLLLAAYVSDEADAPHSRNVLEDLRPIAEQIVASVKAQPNPRVDHNGP